MTQFQIPPRPRWRGFYFALLQCNPIQAFTAAFLSLMQIIPPKLQNRLQGFTGAFLLIWPVPAHAIQQSHKPPAQRWRAYHQEQHPHRYQAPPPRRTLYRSTQPPYYNKVYKGAWVRPVMDSCQPGGAVQQQGARRAARNHWRLAPHLFSGFRPIANKGEQ